MIIRLIKQSVVNVGKLHACPVILLTVLDIYSSLQIQLRLKRVLVVIKGPIYKVSMST